MKRTLLVEIEIEDPGILPELAIEVQSILTDAGIPVNTVKPWNNEQTPITTTAPIPGTLR